MQAQKLGTTGVVALLIVFAFLLYVAPVTEVQGVRGILAPGQAQAGSSQSPCLAPSASDTSNATIAPSSTRASVEDYVPPSAFKNSTAVSSMPQDFQLRMELVFAIRNPTSFQACLNSIQDPSSPYYHNFLDSTTLEPYVPTPGQKLSVASYLEGKGLSVSEGHSPIVLNIEGTVKAVQSAFSTSISLFTQAGRPDFYAPASSPSMPGNFAAMTIAVGGMDNYTRVVPAESPCSGPYCPQGVQVGYSISPLLGSGDSGSGVNVAVVDLPGDASIQTAVNTYDAQYSLPPTTLTVLTPDGAPGSWDPSWGVETALDVESIHTVAPGAQIVVLYAGSGTDDIVNMIDYAASSHAANIVSNSWDYGGGSDTELSSSLVSSVDSRLSVDSAVGLTILFASGDQGARPDGFNLGTEFPASDPNVMAVGATNLVLSGCGTTTCSGYSSETGASISGGGYSGHFPEPSWQSAVKTLPSRGVPDVSMFGYNPFYWTYTSASGWLKVAGTSLSTPLWAGLIAIVEQMNGGGLLGNFAPIMWKLAGSSSYSATFHDVTFGSNGGYSAAPGWDPVTGWGTPVASVLLNALFVVTITTTSTTTTTIVKTITRTSTATTTTSRTTTRTATSTVVTTADTTTLSVTATTTTTISTVTSAVVGTTTAVGCTYSLGEYKCVATVTAADNSGPTGTIKWSSATGSFMSGQSCTTASTYLQCKIFFLPLISPWSVTATYSGDSTHAGSFGTFTHT